MLSRLNYKTIIFVIAIAASGCSAYPHSSIELKAGQGEYRNIHKTERVEAKYKINLGSYHVAIKSEQLKSSGIDDPNYSLIDGSNVFAGIGATKVDTEFTAWFSENYYQLEATNKNNLNYYNLYSITGIQYLNKYGQGRKTTSAVIGLGKKFNNKYCEASYTARNNTQTSVDDFFLFGCGINF